MRLFRRALAIAALALTSLPGLARAEDAKKAPDGGDEADLPPSGLHLAVVPSRSGPWKMIVSNDGDTPRRFIADGRMLWFEIVPAPDLPEPDADDAKAKDKDKDKDKDKAKKPKRAKKPPKPQGYLHGKIPICRMPADMRPETVAPERAVVLDPGDRYEEPFDPFAFCGPGKLVEGVREGAVVYAHLGFPPEKRHPKKKPKKGDKEKQEIPPPPYVSESLKDPPDALPDRSIDAVPIVLTEEALALADEKDEAKQAADAAKADEAKKAADAKPDATKKDATKKDDKAKKVEDERDERAPRLEVRAPKYEDTTSAGDLILPVTVTNVGKRGTLVHLRLDDLAFVVTTPTGDVTECNLEAERRAAVRDFFERLGEGAKRQMSTRLVELCPQDTLSRPGVYAILPRVALHDAGDRYHLTALVGTSDATTPVKVRIHTGRLPYHPYRPKVIKAPKPDETNQGDAKPDETKKGDAKPPPSDAPLPRHQAFANFAVAGARPPSRTTPRPGFAARCSRILKTVSA